MPSRIADAGQLVESVIKDATDAGGPDARALGFKIQNLTDEAGLPKQAPLHRRAA